MDIDPRTATPCRTVAFSPDARSVVEANYLGFVTVRSAHDGAVARRFLAQTALVETIRYETRTGLLALVGAGFEGGRDFGAAKLVDPATGRRVAELPGHTDDATDVLELEGPRRRLVTVGLDRRTIVHGLDDPSDGWIFQGYEDYLNTCAARPGYPGQMAIAGDSPFTYVLDADARKVVAKLDTPGDTNGLAWSADGRFAIIADDFGRALYFDADRGWKLAGEAKVGGAAKRMVNDPRDPSRVLAACYDGRVWSVPRTPDGATAFPLVERRRGMWGINVAATRDRLAVPSYHDRAYLLARDDAGRPTHDVGPEPQPTFGANWVAIHPSETTIAVTHDDGRIRMRDAATGDLRAVLGPDSESLYMGAAYHPRLPILATIDFHGEVLIYDTNARRVIWRQEMGFGPGISVDISPCGGWLAVGGYGWRGRIMPLVDGVPREVRDLEVKNRGVLKSVAFTRRFDGGASTDGTPRLLAASGCGTLVVHDLVDGTWRATRALRGSPAMELSNGVSASPDGRTAYVVSRDQSVRAFDLESGEERAVGLAHVRGVKTVHASPDGRTLATGAYDRSVLLWATEDLSVRVPPVRLANSGISGVRCARDRVFACSFDGVVCAIDPRTGRVLWSRTAADTAEGR